jgi:arginine deiminase
MTPDSTEENLFYDVVPYEPLVAEYRRFFEVMQASTQVLSLRILLERQLSLGGERARSWLLEKGVLNHSNPRARNGLERWILQGDVKEVVAGLIGGVEKRQNNLTDYLSHRSHDLSPLPNLFFTRDPGFVIGNRLFLSAMAHPVRRIEPLLVGLALGAWQIADLPSSPTLLTGSIEGGDVLVVNESTILVGLSNRTTVGGIDNLIAELRNTKELGKEQDEIHRIFVVHLPDGRSMIHLDMVMTMVSRDQALLYQPVFQGSHGVRVTGISWQGNSTLSFQEYPSIFHAMEAAGHPIQAIWGGGADPMVQQREQWLAGINSFALGPDTLLSYETNPKTLTALNDAGFAIVSDSSFLSGEDPHSPKVVTLPGLELARAGGGLRCMTMPLARAPVL